MLDHDATGQQSFNCQKIEPMVSGRAAAEVLGADLDALGLQDLADIEKARKVLRLRIIPEQSSRG